MAKFLSETGLATVWGRIDSLFLRKAGGDVTGTLNLYSASGDSPALVFRRGTLTDTLDDWRIFNTAGNLKFQRTSGSITNWQDYVVFTPTAGTVTINGNTVLHSGNYNSTTYADIVPTQNSTKLITSGGVYSVIEGLGNFIEVSENGLNDRLTTLEGSVVTGTGLTADKIVLGDGERTVKTSSKGIATSVSSSSDDTTVPTSKAVWDAFGSVASALKYRGTVASNSALPATHAVGDVWVVSTAGTFVGKACEVGDYIVCKTAGTSANNAHWDVLNGENQVENKSASLAAAGSSVTIAKVDGTNITVKTPSTWTGLTKIGTITKVGNTDSGDVAVSSSNSTATFGNAVTVGTVGGVDLKFTMPANPNSDTKVTQTPTTSSNSSWRPLILGSSYSDATTFAPTAVTDITYSTHLAKFRPSTGVLGVVGLNKMTTSGTITTGSDTTVWNTNGGTVSLSGYATTSDVWTVSTSRTANTVLAAPNGSNGTASFRALVAADIPNLSWSKITSGIPTTLSGYGITDAASSSHTHTLSIAADSGTNALTLVAGTKYKLTAGGSTFIFTMPSHQSLSGYSTTSHTHTTTLASDIGTSTVTLSAGGKYKLTAGGTSVIFTMPARDTVSVTNSAATIGTSLTTIATINGTNITAKIGSYVALTGNQTISGNKGFSGSIYGDLGGLQYWGIDNDGSAFFDNLSVGGNMIDFSSYVKISGAQTITGAKTFSGGITMSGANILPSADDANSIGSNGYRFNAAYVRNIYTSYFEMRDGTSKVSRGSLGMGAGYLQLYLAGTNEAFYMFYSDNGFFKQGGGVPLGRSDHRWSNVYSVDGNFSGGLTVGGNAVTPANYVTLDGAQTISGAKTFSAQMTASGGIVTGGDIRPSTNLGASLGNGDYRFSGMSVNTISSAAYYFRDSSWNSIAHYAGGFDDGIGYMCIYLDAAPSNQNPPQNPHYYFLGSGSFQGRGGTKNLGSSGAPWGDVYIANNKAIKSPDTGGTIRDLLKLADNNGIYIGNSGITAVQLNATGYIKMYWDSGDAFAIFGAGANAWFPNLLPNGTSGTKNLGSSSARWNNIYGANGYFSGTLEVNGNSVLDGSMALTTAEIDSILASA